MVIEKINEVRQLKFQIKIIDEKINEVRSQMEGNAIKYSDIPKIESYKTNIMQNLMEKIIELENKKSRLQMKIDIIMEEFLQLPEQYYKVVYYKHVDNLNWRQISEKMNYSITQCRRYYDYAKNFKE